MKKFFVVFLSFIFVFSSLSFNVFASNIDDSSSSRVPTPTDYNNWSTGDKVSYWSKWGSDIVLGFIDASVGTSYVDVTDNILQSLYNAGIDNTWEYFADHTTYNNATQSFVADVALQEKLQGVQDDTVSQIDYVDRWICGANDLDPSLFMYFDFYQCFKDLIINNPDYYFKFTHWTNNTAPPYAQEYYIIATKKPFLGGVIADKNYWNYGFYDTTLYAYDWTTNFGKYKDQTVGLVLYNYTSSPDYTNYFDWYVQTTTGNEFLARTAVDAQKIDLDNVISEYDNLTQPQGFSQSYTFNLSSSIDNFYKNGGLTGSGWQNCIFHSVREAFPCFTTLTDLKKGTTGMNSGFLFPGYTGEVPESVSIPSVNTTVNIIKDSSNNNPNGVGSNNNNNNNNNNNDDPSSGSFWDKLGNIVSGLLGFIVDVLNSALEALTNVFDSIQGFFSGAVDLVGSGFADLMGAFFPYIPQEWITIVGLVLGLSVFFFILKHFL